MAKMFDDSRSNGCPGGPAAVEQAVEKAATRSWKAFPRSGRRCELCRIPRSYEVRDLSDSILWMGRAQLTAGASHIELDQEVRGPPPDGRWQDRSDRGLPTWAGPRSRRA